MHPMKVRSLPSVKLIGCIVSENCYIIVQLITDTRLIVITVMMIRFPPLGGGEPRLASPAVLSASVAATASAEQRCFGVRAAPYQYQERLSSCASADSVHLGVSACALRFNAPSPTEGLTFVSSRVRSTKHQHRLPGRGVEECRQMHCYYRYRWNVELSTATERDFINFQSRP